MLTLTPGLIFAPTFRSLSPTFTFAPTPTFGFTFAFGATVAPVAPVPVLDVAPWAVGDGGVVAVLEDWLVEAAWLEVADDPMSVDCWFAETQLDTLWSPPPMFTPGLMFAAAFISVF